MVFAKPLVRNAYDRGKRPLRFKYLNKILAISAVQILGYKVYLELTFKHVAIIRVHIKTWVYNVKGFVDFIYRESVIRLELYDSPFSWLLGYVECVREDLFDSNWSLGRQTTRYDIGKNSKFRVTVL